MAGGGGVDGLIGGGGNFSSVKFKGESVPTFFEATRDRCSLQANAVSHSVALEI